MSDLENLQKRLDSGQKTFPKPFVDKREMVEVTVGELRAACEKSKNKKLAETKKASVAAFKDPERRITVEKADLVEMLEGTPAVVKTVLNDDGSSHTEKVNESPKPPPKTTQK